MSFKQGFIIDVPNFYITTPKGDVHLVTAQSGEITFGGENIAIDGGWSLSSLIEIDTRKTIEITATDAQWNLETMQLTSGGNLTKGADEFYRFGTPYVVDPVEHTITLPEKAIEGSIRINGYEETTEELEIPENSFRVTVDTDQTQLKFNAEDAGKKLYVAYKVLTEEDEHQLTVKTNDFPKSGQVVCQFPIYNDADSDCADIVGYGQFLIYKAKIRPDTTIGGSYKTPSTFDLTLSGLDPRRPDENLWKFSTMKKINA